MDNEQGAAKASLEDLKHGALAHYEEVAAAAHHWSSFIPKAIEAYQEWISVGDRPEEYSKILLWFEAMKEICAGYLINGSWLNEEKKPFWCEPTHWMPLPNPPQSVNS